jgi:hypothetical protein
MDEATGAYAAAGLSLGLQVLALGGSVEGMALETSLDDDGVSVQMLVEVRSDTYAIASFELDEPIHEADLNARIEQLETRVRAFLLGPCVSVGDGASGFAPSPSYSRTGDSYAG